MVCQPAGQTRFRALKHENGVAGCATIIIKVIACFQPLQDCQSTFVSFSSLSRSSALLSSTSFPGLALRETIFKQWIFCFSFLQWFYFRYFRSMGEDFLDPNFHLQHITPQSKRMDTGSNNNSQRCCLSGSQPLICHAQMNPSCQSNMREMITPRPISSNCIQMGSAFSFPLISKTLPTESAVQKRYLVSDRSGNMINLLFYSMISPIQNLNHIDRKRKHLFFSNFPLNLPTDGNQVDHSDKTSAFHGIGNDEMHEDTKEIDALLYSDSDYEEVNGFTETPDIKFVSNDEEVASSNVPTKRKKLDVEMDPSLIDTASSALKLQFSEPGDRSDESSAVNGCFIQDVRSERDISSNNGPNKRLKRDRVREAMCVLRQIVPGGKRKDTTALLDKAIWYLRSLKAQCNR